ncbi:MAG: flagellar biosynthesis protein FlgN, partial [Clostridiaceae bacterium]|nr:flagellar biosynthesis protein FlgN [Clostridiaceae bacterium]
MQVQQITGQMIVLSQKKYEELLILKELSEKQAKAFAEKNLDIIDDLLNKKDEIIKYIQKLDDAFLRAYNTLKEELGINSLDMISKLQIKKGKDLQDLIKKITTVVESIIEIEKG